MTLRQRRVAFLLLVGTLFFAGVGLILVSLRDNLLYFVSPTQLLQLPRQQQRLRLGGLVHEGSITRNELVLQFIITDGTTQVPVHYTGLVPDLFRGGQGVVVEGQMVDTVFMADVLLAKHDERYMPREVVQILKEQGQWRP
ncbi:MAG: cytochrome c maturation protein CcmE [Alphaproteobacteria bacterium]